MNNSNYKVKPSKSTMNSIVEYINKSRYSDSMPLIQQLSYKQNPIVVWGAGQYTLRLLSDTSLKDCNIIAFIDKDKKKQGLRINNVSIVEPNYLIDKQFSGPIIVCSALFSDEIKKEIRAMGLTNEVIMVR